MKEDKALNSNLNIRNILLIFKQIEDSPTQSWKNKIYYILFILSEQNKWIETERLYKDWMMKIPIFLLEKHRFPVTFSGMHIIIYECNRQIFVTHIGIVTVNSLYLQCFWLRKFWNHVRFTSVSQVMCSLKTHQYFMYSWLFK